MISRLLEPELLAPNAFIQARVFALEDSGLLAATPPDAATLVAAGLKADRVLQGGPALTEWRRAVAAELFLLSQWDLRLARELADATLLGTQPLPGGPILQEAFGTPAALALAPLDMPAGAPLLQVWVLHPGKASRGCDTLECQLNDAAQWSADGYRLGAVPPFLGSAPKWPEGSSWRLAAALARRALFEPEGREKWIRSLALHWIVTGDVAGEDIGWVQLGGKRRLAAEDAARASRRRWLVPSACSSDDDFILLREHLPGRLCAVATLREAWAYITGGGLIETREARAWPNEQTVFHAFVSDAVGPIVAPLLLQKAERAVFWISEEKAHFFQAIERFVQIARDAGLVAKNLTAEPQSIQAGSLEEAEACLLALPELTGAGSVLFNITGGNIPMRLALTELARTNRNLRLIYRPERKDGTNHYLELHFPYGLPRTRRLEPRDTRADELINLWLPKLAEGWGYNPVDVHKAFDRWCRENLVRIAEAFSNENRKSERTEALSRA
jgi:hypothetical protein